MRNDQERTIDNGAADMTELQSLQAEVERLTSTLASERAAREEAERVLQQIATLSINQDGRIFDEPWSASIARAALEQAGK